MTGRGQGDTDGVDLEKGVADAGEEEERIKVNCAQQ